jgi:hypothetical protein
MSNTHLEVLRESFFDAADYEYTITATDSDGAELAYIHGCDYEDLCEQSMPDFAVQVVYELSATVNGEEVHGKVSRFTEIGCLEKFEQVEDAANELAEQLFQESIEVDHDSIVKERIF